MVKTNPENLIHDAMQISNFLLLQADLIKALTRAGSVLLEKGAVIEKVESLGHRDLPYKRIAKQTGDSVYASK